MLPAILRNDDGQFEDPILLMKLSKNQEIDFKLIAKKENAKAHAKWSPVATCLMRMEPIVKLNQDELKQLTGPQKEEFVKRCPRNVYSYNRNTHTIEIEEADKCNLCNECVKYVTEDIDGIEYDQAPVIIDEVQNKFIFTVEGTGALPCDRIVIEALRILKEKLKTLKDYQY